MLSLMHDDHDDEGDDVQPPIVEASDQVCDAIIAVDLPAGAYLHMPWRALDVLVEGIAPASVWYVAAFSGHGKTTFLSTALDAWYAQSRRVYMLGLESRPYVLRTHWACKRVGVDAGDLLTGKVNDMPNGAAIKDAVKAELKTQIHDAKLSRVYFSPVTFVDIAVLTKAAKHAKEFGADVVIVDHVDHIHAGGNRAGFEGSQAVQQHILELAHRYRLRFMVATQLNNDAVRGDRLAMYRPPRPEAVFMGGVKRQVAAGMIGLYRPLRERRANELPKEYDAAMDAVRRGDAEPHTVLAPNTMGVVVMKHRARGSSESKRCLLGVEQGRVVNLPEHEQRSQP